MTTFRGMNARNNALRFAAEQQQTARSPYGQLSQATPQMGQMLQASASTPTSALQGMQSTMDAYRQRTGGQTSALAPRASAGLPSVGGGVAGFGINRAASNMGTQQPMMAPVPAQSQPAVSPVPQNAQMMPRTLPRIGPALVQGIADQQSYGMAPMVENVAQSTPEIQKMRRFSALMPQETFGRTL